MRNTIITTLIAVLVIVGFVAWRRARSLPLPSGTPNRTDAVVIPAPNIPPDDLRNLSRERFRDLSRVERPVMVTDGVKHLISLDQIIDGGPGKDGIPSIDRPTFTNVAEASAFLRDEGLGISIVTERTRRFYPFQILVWHEIANDVVDGVPVAVTYCPLCGTGFTFDRRANDRTYEFGVSGKLYQNNLLMYDRTTDTLWQQQTGEAVVGELVGQRLQIFPSENVRWGDWKRLHPNGEVLSRETGFRRDYSIDPYASRGYNEDPSPGLFSGTPLDSRLHAKAMVLGIVVGTTAQAYPWDVVRQRRIINDVVSGLPIVVFEDPISKAITARIRPNGTPITDPAAAVALTERPEFTTSFWFSWAAFHPMTGLAE